MENISRDYDKEPLIIKNRSAYFVLSDFFFWFFLAVIWNIYHLVIYLTTGVGKIVISKEIDILINAGAVFLIIEILISMIINYKYQKENPSYFEFKNIEINFVLNTKFYAPMVKKAIEKDLKTIPKPTLNLEKCYYCVIDKLVNNYGRFHYFTPYEIYKKSSIGVHIGKTVLFLRHSIIFILFMLPYKIYKLTKDGEPFWLLKKNFVIRCKNRNYFLVNVYSVKEYNELLEYFKSLNIELVNKTKFIPQCQNSGSFVDKNEIWSDDFSDTKIPKDTFKKKVRRFFSLD